MVRGRRLAFVLVIAWLLGTGGSLAQTPNLRIVVIEGEAAGNVIQQKTAVAPVIEVRDRNDQPVSGVLVRFAISKGRATFSGARALTVTTNTAGRAIATGLTPTGSGALQISAAATFQGQTVVATIAQTNVMTAATAGAGIGGGSAGGGSAGAGGGGAAGSGGLSATTVGIVGGAVAGGAIAAREVLGGNQGAFYSGPYSGLIADQFSGPSAGCSRTLRHTGTVELELQVADDGSVKGNANIQGTMTAAQASPGCQLPGDPQSHSDGGPVSGTKDKITYHGSHPGNPGVTATYDFSGAFSGSDTIAGPFTLNISSATIVTLGVFPVTLQKQ
jgi:hypothetical protein